MSSDSDEESYNDDNDINEDYIKDHEYKVESLEDLYSEDFEDEDIEYIDDIDGLRDLLDDGDDKLSGVAYEEFPGFIRVKKGD